MGQPLSADQLRKTDAYRRAANYLSVGQIYLLDNPLLREPLRPVHVKPRLLGHWGTTPGQNFLYVHLNRVINGNDLNMLYISGPGHGGPALVANAYLEGTYTEVYPTISRDEEGMKKLFRQFSFPGGIPSHVAPETPGSIHCPSDKDFDTLFTKNKPVVFAFHGYPWLIHRLTYRRTNHKNLHVRGYKEEGTTTTPFDMVVMNDMDRLHLVQDVIDRLPGFRARAAYVKQAVRDKLIDHKHYIRKYGDDMPEARDWKWGGDATVGGTKSHDAAADNA